jgi:hypothetical protein
MEAALFVFSDELIVKADGLNRAAANQTQDDGDNGNYQQNVDDIAHAEAIEAKEAKRPDDDEHNGNEVQQIAHGSSKY